MKIQIKYFDKDLEKIEKIEQGDWIDLRVSETVELKAGEYKLIPLGIGMILPKGYEAHIVPRSSTFKNFGVIQTNHMGVIDESYCGENDQWHFPAYALRDTVIHKNDRICQFRIMKKQEQIEFEEVDSLNTISRGGFGSTGVKQLKQDKNYNQIIKNIIDTDLLMFRPMDVRSLLQLDTKTTYDLFNDNDDFPSIKISGNNYIFKTKLIDWVKREYLS